MKHGSLEAVLWTALVGVAEDSILEVNGVSGGRSVRCIWAQYMERSILAGDVVEMLERCKADDTLKPGAHHEFAFSVVSARLRTSHIPDHFHSSHCAASAPPRMKLCRCLTYEHLVVSLRVLDSLYNFVHRTVLPCASEMCLLS